MRLRTIATAGLAAAVLVLSACDDGTVELSTTSSSLVTGNTTVDSTLPEQATTTTAAPEDGTATTTELVGQNVVSHEIVVRVSGDEGETLQILIPEGAYTEVDLENFIGDLKESDPDLFGVEVFDDSDAVQAFGIPEDQRTAEQQTLLDDHHLVSLVGGDTVRFQGPFAEFGEFIIGS